MSKNHTKRKRRRQNLPKKRGKKRCPRCQSNSMTNGRCSCGYGKSDGSIVVDEFVAKQAESAIVGIAVLAGLVNRRRKNKKKEEDDEDGSICN